MTDERFFDNAYNIKTGNETRDHYARFAEEYDDEVTEHGYVQPQRTVDMLSRYDLAADARVLDVGCGTGLSGSALHRSGFGLIDGCDFSNEMLNVARNLDVYDRLFHADLNKPPIDVEDATYDVATAVGIFSSGHLEADAMDEILRVVRPSGVFVIAMNETYYDLGSVPAKLSQLQSTGSVTEVSREHGEHMPGLGLRGWVLAMRKTDQGK